MKQAGKKIIKKINKNILENYAVYLSFFIPFILLLVFYILAIIKPFGNYSVTIVDSVHQYLPFMSELRDKILSGELKTYPYYSEKYGNMVLKYESKFESITLEVDTYKILTYQPK